MAKIFNKVINWYFSQKALPYWGILLLDILIVLVSCYIATIICVGGMTLVQQFVPISLGVILSSILFVISFRLFHTYTGIVRFSSFVDLQHVILATVTGSAMTAIVTFIMSYVNVTWIMMPGYVCILLIFFISTLLMWIERILVKWMYDTFRMNNDTKNVFIYGVHSGGVSIAKNLQNEDPVKYHVVGFVTPDEDLYSKYLMGALVRHDSPRLVGHMKEKKATILIVSPLEVEHFRRRQELIDDLLTNNITIMMIPPAEEWDGKSELTHRNLKEVEIEDLLPRDTIEVDMQAIGEMLKNKSILVTGAAGSIGSEMARQIAKFNPSELVLIDQAETPMHDVRLYMAKYHTDIKVETIVTSICKQDRMELIFDRYRPEFVFHAAAYKHVPMMEDNPAEAVQNNIYGTRVIADLAVKYGTRKFVMISTDKAVNPTNVMGCSKRICEIYCQALNNRLWEETKKTGKRTTQFITTRFGNVLGSNGSVIPIFREQIKNGGPVTVTHPDIIRYFMLIPEACRLVLEAGTMGKGGEIFVFDMGEPVRIVDLAKRMIKLSGAQNIEIKFSGLRDGEKLYEEVLSDKENTKPTVHPKIMVAAVREYDYETACKNEERLMEASKTFDDMAIVKIMKEIVPEYKSQVSKYQVLDN